MSNPNTPRGFKPLKYSDNRPYSGGMNTYRLPSGYATNIFAGDVVKLISTGYLAKAAAGDQMRGIAAGFKYVSAAGLWVTVPNWLASTVTMGAQDVQVMVIDDPNVVFEAVFTNSASVPAVSNIGDNFNLYDSGGSTLTGLSGEGIDLTTATVSAAQFNFLDFVQRADNDPTSAYSRGLFIPKSHDFRVTTGI